MKVVVTGASGLVGGRLVPALRAAGHQVTGTFHQRGPTAEAERPLDLCQRGAAARLLAEERPDLVVHAAAAANPTECELDPDRARAVNVDAVDALARSVRDCGARLIHLSTDLVFDGGRGPFTEEDEPAPLSVYAQTKREGERRALASGVALVLRCALVFGQSASGTRTFNEWILERARAGEPIPLFNDEYRTPIDDRTLGRIVSGCLEVDLRGTRHCGGGERLSRFEFGRRVAEVAGLSLDGLESTSRLAVEAVPARPEDVSLDSGKLAAELGLELPDVRTALSWWWKDLASHEAHASQPGGGAER